MDCRQCKNQLNKAYIYVGDYFSIFLGNLWKFVLSVKVPVSRFQFHQIANHSLYFFIHYCFLFSSANTNFVKFFNYFPDMQNDSSDQIKKIFHHLCQLQNYDFLFFYKAPDGSQDVLNSSSLAGLANSFKEKSLQALQSCCGAEVKPSTLELAPHLQKPFLRCIDLSNEEHVYDHYYKIFTEIQQLSCKQIAKHWIKEVEPFKQSSYPYKKGNASKPQWWPRDVVHKEPDHIKKEDRIKLLITLVRTQFEKISKGRNNCIDFVYKSAISSGKASLLNEAYYLGQKEQLYKSGMMENKLVEVSDFDEYKRNVTDNVLQVEPKSIQEQKTPVRHSYTATSGSGYFSAAKNNSVETTPANTPAKMGSREYPLTPLSIDSKLSTLMPNKSKRPKLYESENQESGDINCISNQVSFQHLNHGAFNSHYSIYPTNLKSPRIVGSQRRLGIIEECFTAADGSNSASLPRSMVYPNRSPTSAKQKSNVNVKFFNNRESGVAPASVDHKRNESISLSYIDNSNGANAISKIDGSAGMSDYFWNSSFWGYDAQFLQWADAMYDNDFLAT